MRIIRVLRGLLEKYKDNRDMGFKSMTRNISITCSSMFDQRWRIIGCSGNWDANGLKITNVTELGKRDISKNVVDNIHVNLTSGINSNIYN